MTATELRIGNLVYDTKGEVNTVCVETFVKFNQQIKPIPLTEEWLLKFGFDYVDIVGGWCNKNHCIYQLEEGWELHPFCTLDKCLQLKIKYIHQLQNLNFALTSEELQPKF